MFSFLHQRIQLMTKPSPIELLRIHQMRTSGFNGSYHLESPEEEICLQSHSFLLSSISLYTAGSTQSIPKKAFPLAHISLKLYPVSFLPFPDQLHKRKAFILIPDSTSNLYAAPLLSLSPLRPPVTALESLQRPIFSPHLLNGSVSLSRSTVFYHLLLLSYVALEIPLSKLTSYLSSHFSSTLAFLPQSILTSFSHSSTKHSWNTKYLCALNYPSDGICSP